jgi:dephospho-CoA kinase
VNTPVQIGITGGIGSGKSLITRIFGCLGVAVYDADSRAKAVMTTDGILMSRIKKEFGRLSYHEDGTLNREYLAETVFNNPKRLHILNQLVHPRVGEDYIQWLAKHQSDSYVLKEAALVYESGSYKNLDKVVVVYAPVEVRVRRVLKRDRHRDEQQVRSIIERQMSDEEKIKQADYIIINDESKPVIPQVLELHHTFSTGN